MSNEVVKSEPKTASFIVNQMQGQFAKVLPEIIKPERYCRMMLTALNKDKTLMEAFMDNRNQASVLSVFMRIAEMGLEPDNRRAAIVCYKKGNTGTYDITLIPMYQGLCELAMRSGKISTIHAEKVCEKDKFEWKLGKVTVHEPNWREDRGEAYLFYCHVEFKDGTYKDETMSRKEIEEIMECSSAYQGAKRFGKSCPWMTHFEEMAKKTVFRRCSKWLPLSAEQRDMFESDDSDYSADIAKMRPAANDKFAQAAGVAGDDEAIDVEAVPAEESAGHTEGNNGSDSLFGEEAK